MSRTIFTNASLGSATSALAMPVRSLRPCPGMWSVIGQPTQETSLGFDKPYCVANSAAHESGTGTSAFRGSLSM